MQSAGPRQLGIAIERNTPKPLFQLLVASILLGDTDDPARLAAALVRSQLSD